MSPRTRSQAAGRSKPATEGAQAPASVNWDTPIAELTVRDLVGLLTGQTPLLQQQVSDPRVDQLAASIGQLQLELAALKSELQSRSG